MLVVSVTVWRTICDSEDRYNYPEINIVYIIEFPKHSTQDVFEAASHAKIWRLRYASSSMMHYSLREEKSWMPCDETASPFPQHVLETNVRI